jgi:hypothetical protein
MILAFSAGNTGCDTRASRERARLADDQARRRAETDPPSVEVLSQIRAASGAFMSEKHAGESVEGYSFTSLTPNLFLVGVSVRNPPAGGSTVRQLSAERVRDTEESWLTGEPKENGDLLWVIDDLDEVNMKILARRHGLDGEVGALRDSGPGYAYPHSWGRRTWLDDYLLWHYVYHRPAPVACTPGGVFQAQPLGFRFQEPGTCIQPEDARPYQACAAPTGGRSSVFLGGSAWRPPLATALGETRGQAFAARGSGLAAAGSHGFFSRGGFGAAGHFAGGHFGG